MSHINCLSQQELSDYCLGTLDPKLADDVADHVEHCPRCDFTLRQLEAQGDTLFSSLREPVYDDPYLREPELSRVFDLAAALAPAAASGPAVAEQLRDYRLLVRLGQGGMGTVYKAVHTRLDKLVAVKLLPPDRTRDPHAVARFQREMKAVGKLEHPNIVAAHDAGEADGRHYLVMEYVEGLDLAEVSRRARPLAVADACELARQAALGLDYAHHHGLIHRDVKPSNLMLTADGHVKILDLGLALLQGEPVAGGELTGTEQLMGTTDYMAPEQAGDCHGVGGPADIYSLGCTLYKLLTGVVPYGGPAFATSMKKLLAHVNAPVPNLAERRVGLPDGLVAAVERMMAKLPEARFATAAEVAGALAPFAAGSDLPALFAAAARKTASGAAQTHALPTVASAAPIHAASLSQIADTNDYLSSALSGTEDDVSDVAPAESAGNALCGVPLAADPTLPTVTRNATEGVPDRIPPRRRLLVAAAGAAAVLLMGVVIIVKMRDGSTRRFEVKGDVKEFTITPKDDADATTTPADPNREVVKWVFEVGGNVAAVNREAWGWPSKWPESPSDVPDDSDDLMILLMDCQKVTDADLKRFKSLTKPFWLCLTRTHITDAGLAELRGLPNLRILILDETAITRVGLENLGTLPNLETIELQRTATRGADLGLLANFPKLGLVGVGPPHLSLEGVEVLSTMPNVSVGLTAVGEADLKYFGKLSHLQSLSVGGKEFNDACLEPLASLTNLTVLGLWDTSVGNAGIARLPLQAPRLTVLSVSYGRLTDDAVQHLTKLRKLDGLNLLATGVTSAGVAELKAALPNCKIQWTDSGRTPAPSEADREVVKWVFGVGGRVAAVGKGPWAWPGKFLERPSDLPDDLDQLSIVLANCREVTDADLKRLKSLPKLFELSLSGTRITDAGLAELHGLPNLRVLYVDETAITRAGVEKLGVLPNLEMIRLGGTATTPADLVLLSRFPKLAFIQLGRAQLTNEGVVVLSAMKTIDSLETRNDVGLDEFGRIANLSQLRHLAAVGESCSDACLETLSKLANLNDLLLYSTSVTDAGIASLPQVAPGLVFLTVSGGQVTDAAVKHLAALTKLEVVNLRQTQVTAAGVAELQAALPNCKITWTDGSITPPAPSVATDADRDVVKWVFDIGGRISVGEGDVWAAAKAINDASGLPVRFGSLVIGLSDCPNVTDADLKRFRSLSKPFGLALGGTSITDAGLAELHDLPNLRYLYRLTTVTRAGLDSLGVLPNLYNIELNGTSTTDADLSLLSRFPKLHSVALAQAHLTDRGVQVLATMPKIVALYADGAAEAETERIGNLSQLRTLSVGGRQFNDACLEPLSKLTNLISLGLYNTSVTDKGVARLPIVAPRLDYLNLFGAPVTDTACKELAALAKLKALVLTDCRIGDAGLEKLSASLGLELIELSGTDVTDDGLKHLHRLVNLKQLDLTNTQVTAAGVAELKTALPGCNIQR